MKVAIPEWRGRVSPVFDVARNLLLVEVENGAEQARRNVDLIVKEPGARADFVARLGTDVLVCGAISWPLEMALAAAARLTATSSPPNETSEEEVGSGWSRRTIAGPSAAALGY
jgi:predicted Fe-Mo cluster-binding NifX family protein